MDVAGIDQATYDLSVKNPDVAEVVVHRSPLEIMEEISRGDAEILARIRELLSNGKGDN